MKNRDAILERGVFVFSSKTLLLAFQFVLFVAIVTIAPLLNQQIVTGSIVNATLFISVATLGVSATMMVGMLPSVIALSTGLLPPVLAPMVPFIIIGNTLLVLIFGRLYKKNDLLAVISAAVIKFVFLFATSSVVINLLLKKTVASQVSLMMSWPQLLTAIIGGGIAIVFLHLVYKGGDK
ncbi:MAG TPA: iron hydrogenase [bacterium]|nr:iron hydrogenase [bacterium]